MKCIISIYNFVYSNSYDSVNNWVHNRPLDKKKQNLWRFFLILFFKFYGKKNSRLFIFWSSTNNHYIAAIFNCQKIHSSNIKKSNFWPLFIFVKRNEWPSMRTAATNYKNLTGSWYSTISKNTLLISIWRCCIPLLMLNIKKFNFVMFKITNKKREIFVFCHFDSVMNIFWRYVSMKCSIVAEIVLYDNFHFTFEQTNFRRDQYFVPVEWANSALLAAL